ncbi:MAG: hypothetical protein A2W95_04020 [Bacteroidetes bacterium GWA2_40_14]|nr:MAG: hypothetical protein A2W95_04020 [Bacteroidetes bacterium GWA2_40_14]HAZ04245.1 hypothetical protein [Marinilabiliales bacterium]
MTIHSDIDRIFKDGLADYSPKPPSFIWGTIEQVLERKRKKRQIVLFYSAAASVALLLSFGAGYLFTGVNGSDDLIATNSTVSSPESSENSLIQKSEAIVLDGAKTNETFTNPSVNKDSRSVRPRNKANSNKLGTELPITTEKKDTTFKKVNSEGILLPPMFGQENVYDPSATHNQTYKEDENLSKMEMKYPALDNSRDLNYEYREVPMYPEEEKAAPILAGNWEVGIAATPLVSYRSVGNVPTETLKDADIFTNYEQNYTNEKPLTSYSAGIDVNYCLSDRWNIQSGLYVSEIGQVSKDVEVNWQFNANNEPFYYLNTSTGNVKIYGTTNELVREISNEPKNMDYSAVGVEGSDDIASMNESATTDFVQTYNYCEIPLIVSYKLFARKFEMNLTGGLSANVLYKNQVYAKNEGNQYPLDSDNEDIKTMSYSGVFGIGFAYPIMTKLFLNLQPTLRYSLSPINEAGNVYPYSVGIYTGLKYHF